MPGPLGRNSAARADPHDEQMFVSIDIASCVLGCSKCTAGKVCVSELPLHVATACLSLRVRLSVVCSDELSAK